MKKFLLFPLITLLLGVSLFYFLNNNIQNCANSATCIKDLSGEYKEKENSAVFLGRTIPVPSFSPGSLLATTVLGESDSSNKRIYVDLTSQRIYAYEGTNLIYNFLISSGKWGRTPTGDFRIWIKLRYTTMSGGNKSLGTYYYLPNVPYTMYFYNSEIPKSRGYGLHGTYWHNNFGHPMSHGCVNMKTEDAEKIYYWSNPKPISNTTYAAKDDPGTLITIYGTAPLE